MVFPDLLSANLTVKAIMYTVRLPVRGSPPGDDRPRSPSCPGPTTAATRLNSLALALAILDR